MLRKDNFGVGIVIFVAMLVFMWVMAGWAGNSRRQSHARWCASEYAKAHSFNDSLLIATASECVPER